MADDPVRYTSRMSLVVAPNQHEWLRRMAFEGRMSKSAVIRELIYMAMDAERGPEPAKPPEPAPAPADTPLEHPGRPMSREEQIEWVKRMAGQG